MKISNTWDDRFARFLLSQNNQIAKDLVEAALSKEEVPIRIKNIIPQMRMAHPDAHEVIYDALIETEEGTQIDLEIQNLDSPDWIPRLFYNESFLVQRTLPKNEQYRNMKRRIVIGYCNFPVLENNFPIYHIGRTLRETGQNIDDRGQIILVNGKYPHHVGLLKNVLHDMSKESPDEMVLKSYREAYQFLTTQKGEEAMSAWMEETIKEAVTQAVNATLLQERIEQAQELIEEGADRDSTIARIARKFSDENLKNDFLKALKASVV